MSHRLSSMSHRLSLMRPHLSSMSQHMSLMSHRLSFNEPPLVLNEPSLVLNEPPLVLNEPLLVLNEPPLVLNEPPLVPNEPPLFPNDPPLVPMNHRLSSMSRHLSSTSPHLFSMNHNMSKKRLFWSYLSWPWFEFLTSLNVAVQPSNKAQYKSEDDFCPFVFQFTKQAKKAAESLETVGKSAMMASKSKVIAKGGASAVTADILYIFLRHQVLGHRKRLGISCHSWLSFISYSYFGSKSKVIAKDGFSCRSWTSFISYFGSKSKVIAKGGS